MIEVERLSGILRRVAPVPAEWLAPRSQGIAAVAAAGTRKPCSRWELVETSWRKALHWRQALRDAIVAALSVACSTSQRDDQLFLQMIGSAGSAKTRLCDALLRSPTCFALEHLTGFHSGWKDASGEDFSLLSRINHMTLITPEGDVLMSSPKFVELMSQQRRIFDGTSGASYKNRKEDLRYTGLRTPWIIAGTPALLDTDQSRLGDRFLRIFIDDPDNEGRDAIMQRAGHSALRAVTMASNGDEAGSLSPELNEAYELTGGYVDYLRAGASELLSQVLAQTEDVDEVVNYCSVLATFTAKMRARPSQSKTSEERHDTVELPSRLVKQFCRLAMCSSAVLNQRGVTEESLRVVKKVALDTSRGRTLQTVKILAGADLDGYSAGRIAVESGWSEDREKTYLGFLQRVGVVECKETAMSWGGRQLRWSLTDEVAGLWRAVSGI